MDVFGADSDDSMWDDAASSTDDNIIIHDPYTNMFDLAHEADEVSNNDDAISIHSSDSEMESSDDEKLTFIL